MAFLDIKQIFTSYYDLIDNWRSLTSYEHHKIEKQLEDTFLNNTTTICGTVRNLSGSERIFWIYVNDFEFKQTLLTEYSHLQYEKILQINFSLKTRDESQIKNNLKNLEKACNITGRIGSIQAKINEGRIIGSFSDTEFRLRLYITLEDCTISYSPTNWLTKEYLNIPDTVDNFVQQRIEKEQEYERSRKNAEKKRMEEEIRINAENRKKNIKKTNITIGVICGIILFWLLAPKIVDTIIMIIIVLLILALLSS